MIRTKGILKSLHREHRTDAIDEATREYFSKIMADEQPLRTKAAQADLKHAYRRTVELCMVASLTLVIGGSLVSRVFSISAEAAEPMQVQIQVADIPVTEQFRRPPAPPKPSIPIPTESEAVPEDVTIASTEIDLSDIPPPPPPPGDGEEIFIAYDEPPEIIGGMKALVKQLKYPRVAQAAGLEAVVFVKVQVGTDGTTEKTEILKAKPEGMGFEEAAMDALRKMRWKPAKQRDRSIRVAVSIPVQFKLVSS